MRSEEIKILNKNDWNEAMRIIKRGEISCVKPFGSLIVIEDDFIREVDFLKW